MPAIAARALLVLSTLLPGVFLAATSWSQPADLPAECSRLVIQPHQEELIERLMSAKAMAGVMPVRNGDIQVKAAAIEATYLLGEAHDTGTARYRLRPGRADETLVDGAASRIGRMVLERISPCVEESDRQAMLCVERNGRAALAALHLQLKARLDGGARDLQWRCLDKGAGAATGGATSGDTTARELARIRTLVGSDRAAAGAPLEVLVAALKEGKPRAKTGLDLAILHHQLSRPAGVRPWLDATLAAAESSDPADLQARAVALAMSGKQAEAATTLASCRDARPPCSPSAAAALLERLDRPRLAVTLLDESAPDSGKPSAGHYLTRIRITAAHPKAGGLQEAKRWLDSALKAWPEDVPLREQAATLAAEAGDFGQALDQATTLYRLAPENAATFELIAGWMRQLSDPALADPKARAALQGRFDALATRLAKPDANILDRYLGGLAALHVGNIGCAAELLKAVAGAHPKHVQVAIHLALAHLKSGEQPTALAQADRAIKLAPEHPEAWYVVAQVRVHGDRPGAIAALRRHLELSRRDPGHTAAFDERIERDLGLLQAGELPAGWQPPAQPRAGMGGSAVSTGDQGPVPAGEPLQLPAPPGALAMLAALALLGGLYWWWRRQK